MIQPEESYYQRRIATSQVTTIISITLVLFLMGLFGLIILHAKVLSDYVKENIGFSIMIKEGVKEGAIIAFQKKLDREEFVKSTEYIPKEKAAVQLKKELGEDFIGFLGYNPLLPTIDLRLKADYANMEQVQKIEKKLLLNPEVKEVFYQKSLVELVNQNIERISLVILGFSLVLLLISIALINNPPGKNSLARKNYRVKSIFTLPRQCMASRLFSPASPTASPESEYLSHGCVASRGVCKGAPH